MDSNINGYDPEAEVEEMVDKVIEDDEFRQFSFLINASNQANLAKVNKVKQTQINALLVLIHPYYIKNLDLEDFNLTIDVSEAGNIRIEDCELKLLEIKPGVKVFGIIKEEQGVM